MEKRGKNILFYFCVLSPDFTVTFSCTRYLSHAVDHFAILFILLIAHGKDFFLVLLTTSVLPLLQKRTLVILYKCNKGEISGTDKYSPVGAARSGLRVGGTKDLPG